MQILPQTHFEFMSKPEGVGVGHMLAEIDKVSTDVDIDLADFLKLITGMFGSLPGSTEDQNLTLRMLFHIWCLRHSGQKIYYMPKNTCELVQNTKLNIDAQFIEAPYPHLYLYTDQDNLVIKDHTGARKVKGIYVSVTVESDGIKKLRFLATSGSEGIEDYEDVNHYASFNIPESGNLENICEEHIKKYMSEEYQVFQNAKHPINISTIGEIFKFTVNSLIYLGCKNVDFTSVKPLTLEEAIAGKKNKGKIRKTSQKFKNAARLPFTYIDRDAAVTSGRSTGTGKSLDHKVLVAGHWKVQWSGSRKDDTRKSQVIRISPYSKGEGLEEKENKKYYVK